MTVITDVTDGELFSYSQHLWRVQVFLFVMAIISTVGFVYADAWLSPASVALMINAVVWSVWAFDIRKRRSDTIDKLADRTMERIRAERARAAGGD